MSLRVDDVSKIDASKETWAIVVKVVRLWLTPSYSGSKLPSSLEMVLMDSKGCKIHASIRRTLVYRFKNQLLEGRVYQISFFGVCENDGDFRTTPHPYKVNFQMHTSVRLMANTPITGKPFTFMPLSDVVFKDPDTFFLIDVIGILTGSSGEQEFEKHGKVQKRITLEIKQEGVRVEAAFFGKYVDEIFGQLASGDMTNAVVVVQFAKIKPFKGRPSIQNVYEATQILFNPAIDEAGPIRERFFESNGLAAKVICQLQDSAKLSPAEDFLKQNEGKTIEQIKDLAEKSVCVVFATVKFIPDDNSWYYPACKCNKKVYPAEDMYFCEACVRHVVTAIPIYKIRLRVMDAKDSTTFVLFDQEANNLLNKPCSELVGKCHKVISDIPKSTTFQLNLYYFFSN
ncbi:replication protein A 70 kDa DNA-binding subunit B-like [Lotus japonicus]|uniref:replication protein A 70 kDa DNA-binding subunit B-like n=1 Tax=Lotus japonicus TaxID=34305 RepID=UPI002587F453|nr:replication protein A 70 kDa DNA-binding subunit B-like [Lotus japonicus]